MKKAATLLAFAIITFFICAFGIVQASAQVVIAINAGGPNAAAISKLVQQHAHRPNANTMDVKSDKVNAAKPANIPLTKN